MNNNPISQSKLMRLVLSRFLAAIIALGLMFFLPAWTLAYWQAWVFMVLMFGFMGVVLNYLIKHDPDLLVRRMRMREKRAEQNLIVKLSYIPFLVAFILPGFDVRLGWSHVPLWLEIVAFILAFTGYGIVFLVFRENSYTSRIIEVEQGQKVISSGPYAMVRHPMYVGVLLLYIMSPLAMGSYWAVIPALVTIPVLVARILNEEKVLIHDLPGYQEYVLKTRFRLLPGIW